jgi:hypothetical protein
MTAAFKLTSPAVNRTLNLVDPGPEPVSLTTKYRPQTLAEMVGQHANVVQLQSFLDAPFSTAFVFAGPTGVGKTTAALALAAELGAVEFGGLEVVKSGTQDAEMVERILQGLRYTPMCGSGWKVVVCDEADLMSPKAGQLWLSVLEDLPPRAVIIFTSNHPEKFPARFLDRCERLDFDADAKLHAPDAQALVNKLWKAECGTIATAPTLAELNGGTGAGRVIDSEGWISYRRVIRALEPLVRRMQSASKCQSDTRAAKPEPRPATRSKHNLRRNPDGSFTICRP